MAISVQQPESAANNGTTHRCVQAQQNAMAQHSQQSTASRCPLHHLLLPCPSNIAHAQQPQCQATPLHTSTILENLNHPKPSP